MDPEKSLMITTPHLSLNTHTHTHH